MITSAFRRRRFCLCKDSPPVTVAIEGHIFDGEEHRSVKCVHNWCASSLVGDRMSATGGFLGFVAKLASCFLWPLLL